MAFISGPRQVGKSTLARKLLKSPHNNFSWDQTEFRRVWSRFPEQVLQNIGKGPVLLDEIHKDRKWKLKLKGIYDSFSKKIPIIVTGSARLDIYRKGSDSLLGRYIPYRLHPFSVAESKNSPSPTEILTHFKVVYKWSLLDGHSTGSV